MWIVIASLVLLGCLIFIAISILGYTGHASSLTTQLDDINRAIEHKTQRVEDYRLRAEQLQDTVPQFNQKVDRLKQWIAALKKQKMQAEKIQKATGKQPPNAMPPFDAAWQRFKNENRKNYPMEVIVFFALIAVVAVKGFTTHSIHALESQIRAAQADEAEISERLQSTESSLRALEKEHKVLEQEIKHLENDKDLATLEVAKAGGKPLTEEQLDQLLNAASQPRNNPTKPPAQKSDASAQNAQEETPTEPSEQNPESAPKKAVKNRRALQAILTQPKPMPPQNVRAFWLLMTMTNCVLCFSKHWPKNTMS